MTASTRIPEPGCYIDSHHGHYAIPRVIAIAPEFGRDLDEQAAKLLERYDTHYYLPEYPHELLIEESDAAVQWLNDHRRPDGHYWAWFEGDFGLYPVEEEE